jgi:crotonobetaine/carnitine-CoA ligase
MMAGYYNKPEATVEAWRNLWFHTGDFARIDAEGYLYFVDRKKDSIRRRGENISSFEVERAINQHPAILECAVIAVPSPLGEDEIAAVLVAQPNCTIDFADLTAFLDDELPYFMVPRYLREVPALPKTANEKIQKFELRSTGAGGITDDTWDRLAAGVQLERESRR